MERGLNGALSKLDLWSPRSVIVVLDCFAVSNHFAEGIIEVDFLQNNHFAERIM